MPAYYNPAPQKRTEMLTQGLGAPGPRANFSLDSVLKNRCTDNYVFHANSYAKHFPRQQ